jgi:hypothetical protein
MIKIILLKIKAYIRNIISFSPWAMRLTIYMLPYLITFRTRLPFLSCIYKASLLKLPHRPFLYNVILKSRLMPKSGT